MLPTGAASCAGSFPSVPWLSTAIKDRRFYTYIQKKKMQCHTSTRGYLLCNRRNVKPNNYKASYISRTRFHNFMTLACHVVQKLCKLPSKHLRTKSLSYHLTSYCNPCASQEIRYRNKVTGGRMIIDQTQKPSKTTKQTNLKGRKL